MKNFVLIFTSIIIISCVSKKQISDSEKENLKIELSEMVEIDQKYAGIPFGDYLKNEKNFYSDRDSINKFNKEKIIINLKELQNLNFTNKNYKEYLV